MEGGSITGNTTTTDYDGFSPASGGVYIDDSEMSDGAPACTFSKTGGTISGNSVVDHSGKGLHGKSAFWDTGSATRYVDDDLGTSTSGNLGTASTGSPWVLIPPSAALDSSVTITGTAADYAGGSGSTPVSSTITIDVSNGTMNNALSGDDVSGWFNTTVPPLTYKATSSTDDGDTVITITVAGTPTAPSSSNITIKIPGSTLKDSAGDPYTSPIIVSGTAKYNVGQNAYSYDASGGFTGLSDTLSGVSTDDGKPATVKITGLTDITSEDTSALDSALPEFGYFNLDLSACSFADNTVTSAVMRNLSMGSVQITGIVLPSGLTSIASSAFSGFSDLKSVSIPESDTSIGARAFSSGPLTSVTLPSGLLTIGMEAFMSCSNLTTVTIPASVTSIGTVAFSDDTSITDVTMLGTTPPAISSSFDGQPIFHVPANTVASYKAKTGWSGFTNIVDN
jgi:hypothetical protein